MQRWIVASCVVMMACSVEDLDIQIVTPDGGTDGMPAAANASTAIDASTRSMAQANDEPDSAREVERTPETDGAEADGAAASAPADENGREEESPAVVGAEDAGSRPAEAGAIAQGGCNLAAAKENASIPHPNTGTFTLTSDKVWTLSSEGPTYVDDQETLTIAPCTTIVGLGPDALLVVTRGGTVHAAGKPDAPIVFTSAKDKGTREAGDWGGIIILGRAPNLYLDLDFPITEGDTVNNGVATEGLPFDNGRTSHGGNQPDDSSGVLTYIRVEFAGADAGEGLLHNALSLSSVGRGTVLDHVLVNSALGDAFEWFGGTVNANHLISINGQDDLFDVDGGYVGQLRYLFGRQSTTSSRDPNGLEVDGDNTNELPTTVIEVEHATLCGRAGPAVVRGALLREQARGNIDDLIVTGFDYGIDVRDDFGTTALPNITITNSLVAAPFPLEAPDSEDDNDSGFDEVAWFAAGAGNSSTQPFAAADCLQPLGPTPAVTQSARGAFASGSDWHLESGWIDWSER